MCAPCGFAYTIQLTFERLAKIPASHNLHCVSAPKHIRGCSRVASILSRACTHSGGFRLACRLLSARALALNFNYKWRTVARLVHLRVHLILSYTNTHTHPYMHMWCLCVYVHDRDKIARNTQRICANSSRKRCAAYRVLLKPRSAPSAICKQTHIVSHAVLHMFSNCLCRCRCVIACHHRSSPMGGTRSVFVFRCVPLRLHIGEKGVRFMCH